MIMMIETFKVESHREVLLKELLKQLQDNQNSSVRTKEKLVTTFTNHLQPPNTV